jgi:two-component system cell cycle response regulator DivK
MSYILLVEDNKENADMIIRILTSEGFTIKHFLRGLEGAQFARQERPDLILMDFDLPDIDGRTLVLTLRKQLGDKLAPPIAAVTARTGAVEMQVARRFGCSAFLSKPFTPEKLITMVQQLLAKTTG